MKRFLRRQSSINVMFKTTMLNNTFRFIALTILVLIIPNCSLLGVKTVIKPESSGGWSEVKGQIYSHEFNCGDQTIQVREVLIGAYSFLGIPLIPFLGLNTFLGPNNDYLGPKKFNIDINISSNNKPPDDPIIINIFDPSDSKTYSPSEVIPLKEYDLTKERDFNKQFILRVEVGRTNITHIYKFDLERNKFKSFEIVFLSDFKNCKIPNIKYKIDRVIRYYPFIVPFDYDDWVMY